MERAILDLRAGLDAAGQAGLEADLRAAFGLPADRRDRAVEVVVRSWESRRELEATPDAPSWLA
jgi:hypothetical protein